MSATATSGSSLLDTTARVVVPLGAAACLLPFVSSAAALVLGTAIALGLGNPYAATTRKLTPRMLALSVVGLGAGMDLAVVGRVGLHGIGYTLTGIVSTLVIGTLLGRALRTDRNTSLLITAGTAICGGSAIAAVAPVIRARSHEISVALGTVFLLNALALVIFPGIGHALGLDQAQFGLWSALAIHDTSSVVGASMQYGTEALRIGTTVKLARALWIAPLALALGAFEARRETAPEAAATTATLTDVPVAGKPAPRARPKFPLFILGFIAAAALVTWVPALHPAGEVVASIARRALVVTLFVIGVNLNRETLRSVGVRPLIQGVVLWIVVASASLAAIASGLAR